jgi:asparagine synthase (glutamine-hydrolysing)
MCGIVGVAAREPVAARECLRAGRDAMQHRGPDDAGEWWSADAHVGMGHRRLAIVDLTPSGHQPMRDATSDLCIVFNGEIYNFRDLREQLTAKGHRFESHSDTEVLLAAYREWGTDCLSRLNGMFAFALYDGRCRQVFLARDRAGEKPLFYSVDNGTLRFASELKGLLADESVPRRIDRDALDCYLAMGFVPGALSILQGISKLPPAHALTFELDGARVRVWRYWQLPELARPTVPAHSPATESALLEELETLLEDSVRRQLVADVPVGILLSGGVDSSLVTALAVRAAPAIKTFTVRFPGYEQYDETKHARLIADHFRTEHAELDATETGVELLPMLARQFDEPIVDSSMIPTYLVSKLVRRHCTVALGGDGGDELFGGYGHYSRLLWVDEKLGGIPQSLKSAVAAVAGALLPVGFKGRNWMQGLAAHGDTGLPLIANYFDQRTRHSLVGGTASSAFERIRQQRIPNSRDLLQRATRMDFENYLVEDILVKVDRSSMLNSLEVRAPLLDYRVIEFAFGKVPSYLKATPTSRKILLKMLTKKLLPPAFDRERKRGFSIPLAAWLRTGPWRDFFADVLLGSSGSVFDRKTVRMLVDGQAKGRANSERLFALVMIELWRREYRVVG